MGDLTYNSSGSRLQEKVRFLVRKTADPLRRTKGASEAMDVDVPAVPFCPVTLDIPQELLTRLY